MRKIVELTLFTDRLDELTRFYSHVLACEPETATEDIALFRAGGVTLLIHRSVPPRADGLPNVDHFAIGVDGGDGVDRAAAELEEADTPVPYPPRDYEWGRSAYLNDPDGRLVELSALPDGDGLEPTVET